MNTLLDIIREIECLLWAIVILVAIYKILKNCYLPKVRLDHERKMKAEAFDREKEWRDLEKSKEEIEKELNKQIKELKEEKDKLEKELRVVNNWNDLLQNQQKVCIELYNKLSSEIKLNETK